MRYVLCAMLALVMTASAAGCSGGASATDPEQTLRAYARALEQGDHDAAYAMMSNDFREKHAKKSSVPVNTMIPYFQKRYCQANKACKGGPSVGPKVSGT